MDTEAGSGGLSPDTDRQQPLQEDKSDYVVRDRSRQKKKRLQNVSREKIRELVQKAREAHSLANLYPLGTVVQGALIFRRVSSSVVDTLKAVLDEEPRHPIVKLDFLRRTLRARHGRLVITLPNILHEAFGDFSNAIKTSMIVQGFIPAVLGDRSIRQLGSATMDLSHSDGSRKAEPDASLGLFGGKFPFLVFECARTQLEEDVVLKAQDYIHGSRGQISFVVMIKIDTPKARRHEEPVIREPGRLALSDKVSVSVFTPAYKQKPESSRRTLTMATLVDKLEVFPTPPTTRDFFTIRWSHVHYVPWNDFVSEHGLPLDAPEPTCNISFSILFMIAQENAGPKPKSRSAQTPEDLDIEISYKRRSATELSSGSSVTSEDERRADPDYEP